MPVLPVRLYGTPFKIAFPKSDTNTRIPCSRPNASTSVDSNRFSGLRSLKQRKKRERKQT